MKKEQQILEMQLFASVDEYIIEQVCEILNKNDIPFIKRTAGSGSYVNISMGQSFQEKRIFVNKEDYDKSLKLVEAFTIKEENEEVDSEMKQEINKYALIKKIMVFLTLGLPILAIILIILSDIFRN